jgi:hypothetical protein
LSGARRILFTDKLATRATLGMVLYPSLSNTDMNTVLASYRTIFSVPTTFDSRIVAKTDSIMAADKCTNNVELFRQMSLHGTPEIFNVAIGGQALSDNVTDYTAAIAGSTRLPTAPESASCSSTAASTTFSPAQAGQPPIHGSQAW